MNIEAYFKVSYGLYIISSGNSSKKSGYIANTAFQVTAEPARFAISCSHNNFTIDLIRQSKAFSISVLSKNASQNIISLFGYSTTRQNDKFGSVKYVTGKTGVPIVTEDCIAWFELQVEQEIKLDTHSIFIGKMIENDLIDAEQEPLTYAYYRDVKKGIAPKNAPTYINKDLLQDKKKEQPKTDKSGKMKKYRCLVCGHIYDPEMGDPDTGIPPGTAFVDLPDDWYCPVCSAGKEDFEVDE